MSVKVRYRMNPNAQIVVGDIASKAAYRAAQKVRGMVLSNIRSLGRIDTGKMIRLVQARKVTKEGAGGYTVASTAPYTVFQEFGTRAHGPVHAPFMVFKPKGSGSLVFAKWVRGVKAGLFFTHAYQQAKAADFL